MKRWITVCAVCVLIAMQGVSNATPLIVGLDVGGAGADNWKIENSVGGTAFGTIPGPVANGVPSVFNSGIGGIPITGGNSPGPFEIDRLYDADLNNMDWESFLGKSEVQGIRFDFFSDASGNGASTYAASDNPQSLALFFLGSSGGVWYRYMSPSASWSTFYADLNPALWDDLSGNDYGETEFLTDIRDVVSRVGVEVIYREGVNAQHFGIGGFELYYVIPEPQTYASLAAALLSVGVAFRRRLQALVPTGNKTAAA